jgi:hypothetical protein
MPEWNHAMARAGYGATSGSLGGLIASSNDTPQAEATGKSRSLMRVVAAGIAYVRHEAAYGRLLNQNLTAQTTVERLTEQWDKVVESRRELKAAVEALRDET